MEHLDAGPTLFAPKLAVGISVNAHIFNTNDVKLALLDLKTVSSGVVRKYALLRENNTAAVNFLIFPKFFRLNFKKKVSPRSIGSLDT